MTLLTTDHRPGHAHASLHYAEHGVLLRHDEPVSADAEFCRRWFEASSYHCVEMMPVVGR